MLPTHGGEWGYFQEVTTELPIYYVRHFGVAAGDLDLDGRASSSSTSPTSSSPPTSGCR